MGYFLYRQSFFFKRGRLKQFKIKEPSGQGETQVCGSSSIDSFETSAEIPPFAFLSTFVSSQAPPLFKAEAPLQGSPCAVELLSLSESFLSIMSISRLCVWSSVCPKNCYPLWGNAICINAIACSGSRLSACPPLSFGLSLLVLGLNDFHNSTQVHVTTIKWNRWFFWLLVKMNLDIPYKFFDSMM